MANSSWRCRGRPCGSRREVALGDGSGDLDGIRRSPPSWRVSPRVISAPSARPAATLPSTSAIMKLRLAWYTPDACSAAALARASFCNDDLAGTPSSSSACGRVLGNGAVGCALRCASGSAAASASDCCKVLTYSASTVAKRANSSLAAGVTNSGWALARLFLFSSRYLAISAWRPARSSLVVASRKLLRARPTLIRAILASLMYDSPSSSWLYICPPWYRSCHVEDADAATMAPTARRKEGREQARPHFH